MKRFVALCKPSCKCIIDNYRKAFKSYIIFCLQVGCDPDYGDFDVERMVECLRAKHYDEIVNGTAAISKKVKKTLKFVKLNEAKLSTPKSDID